MIMYQKPSVAHINPGAVCFWVGASFLNSTLHGARISRETYISRGTFKSVNYDISFY